MIDYSEFGEQAFILEFFKGRKGRFLDLGALDGMTSSCTRALLENGWYGVYVEPNPESFIRLLKNSAGYLDSCEHILGAVMPESDPAFFWDTTFENQPPNKFDGAAGCTCNAEFFIKFKLPVRQKYVVSSITPEQIACFKGGDFNFVSIDIEGMDVMVMGHMKSCLGDTELLCVEDHHDREEILEACALHGFNNIAFEIGSKILLTR